MNAYRKRILYWSLTIIWFGVILATLQYAREWSDEIAKKYSEGFIPSIAAGILIAILVYSIIRLIRTKAQFFEYAVFAIIIAIYSYYFMTINIPIEKVHFLEYGLLAIFIILAIRVDRGDAGGYLIAGLLVTLAGCIDEYIQGLLPNRVGQLSDIYLNIIAGVLSLCWYRICIKPDETRGGVRSALAVSLPLMGIIIVVIGIFNSQISEFGYLIRDEEIGDFYTRMSPEKLGKEFPEKEFFVNETAPKLYVEDYSTMLKIVKNKIHGEVLVHIFRRDRHVRDKDYITSYRENQILEKFFGDYIKGTKHQWDALKMRKAYELSLEKLNEHYISPVSDHLIVQFSEKAQWTLIMVLNVIFIAASVLLTRKRGS